MLLPLHQNQLLGPSQDTVGGATFVTKVIKRRQFQQAPDLSAYVPAAAPEQVFVPRAEITKRRKTERKLVTADVKATVVATVAPVVPETVQRIAPLRTEFDRLLIKPADLSNVIQPAAPPATTWPSFAAPRTFKTSFERQLLQPRIATHSVAPAPAVAPYPSFVQRFDQTRNATNRRLLTPPDTYQFAAGPAVADWPSFKRPEIFRSKFSRTLLTAPPTVGIAAAANNDSAGGVSFVTTRLPARKLIQVPALVESTPAPAVADWPSYKRPELYRSEFKRTLIEAPKINFVAAAPAPAEPLVIRIDVERRGTSKPGLFLVTPSVGGPRRVIWPEFKRPIIYRSEFKRRFLSVTPWPFVDKAPAVFPWPSFKRPEIFKTEYSVSLIEAVRINFVDKAPAVAPYPSTEPPELFKTSVRRELVTPNLDATLVAEPAVVEEVEVPQTGGGWDKTDNFTIRDARYIPEDDDRVMMLVIQEWLRRRR